MGNPHKYILNSSKGYLYHKDFAPAMSRDEFMQSFEDIHNVWEKYTSTKLVLFVTITSLLLLVVCAVLEFTRLRSLRIMGAFVGIAAVIFGCGGFYKLMGREKTMKSVLLRVITEQNRKYCDKGITWEYGTDVEQSSSVHVVRIYVLDPSKQSPPEISSSNSENSPLLIQSNNILV